MKNYFMAFVAATIPLASNASDARICGVHDFAQIERSLERMSEDPFQTGAEREKAAFALSLIVNESELGCDLKTGFSGNIYLVTTSTHKISISFLGPTIFNLEVDRTRAQ